MIDIARLDRLRRHLRENPSLHNQDTYACDTSACAAGWTVALEHNAQVGDNISKLISSFEVYNASPSSCSDWNFRFNWEGDISACGIVSRYARMLLGLTAEEATALFYRTIHTGYPEETALRLLDALINREKGELTEEDCELLVRYGLSTEPSGDNT